MRVIGTVVGINELVASTLGAHRSGLRQVLDWDIMMTPTLGDTKNNPQYCDAAIAGSRVHVAYAMIGGHNDFDGPDQALMKALDTYIIDWYSSGQHSKIMQVHRDPRNVGVFGNLAPWACQNLLLCCRTMLCCCNRTGTSATPSARARRVSLRRTIRCS